jgi:hypothetical protein
MKIVNSLCLTELQSYDFGGRTIACFSFVMPGLVPGIHVFTA